MLPINFLQASNIKEHFRKKQFKVLSNFEFDMEMCLQISSPIELVEMILLKASIIKYTSRMRNIVHPEYDVYEYLTSVCTKWRDAIISRPWFLRKFSHHINRKFVFFTYLLIPYQPHQQLHYTTIQRNNFNF